MRFHTRQSMLTKEQNSSCKMVAPLSECTTLEQRSVVGFLWAKVWSQRIFIKKRFPSTVWSAFHLKLFKLGAEVLWRADMYRRRTPRRPANGDCHRGECATGCRLNPSRQKGNYRHYSSVKRKNWREVQIVARYWPSVRSSSEQNAEAKSLYYN
jgi:hypothetical protein